MLKNLFGIILGLLSLSLMERYVTYLDVVPDGNVVISYLNFALGSTSSAVQLELIATVFLILAIIAAAGCAVLIYGPDRIKALWLKIKKRG